MYKLLSVNTKLLKGQNFGFYNVGLSLSPHRSSGYQTCPMASKGCAAACLFGSGAARAYPRINQIRIGKTKMFFEDRARFIELLHADIRAAQRKANRMGKKLVVRLNVLSDIQWENYGVIQAFPEVQFMDYTKIAKRLSPDSLARSLPNYHLTFSRSESNQADVQKVIAWGGNVAVVFRGDLPAMYLGLPVISGDDHDIRCIDPKGVIVGLVEKKTSVSDTSGFVVAV